MLIFTSLRQLIKINKLCIFSEIYWDRHASVFFLGKTVQRGPFVGSYPTSHFIRGFSLYFYDVIVDFIWLFSPLFKQYLDENKSLILKIVESQNSGKLSECAE